MNEFLILEGNEPANLATPLAKHGSIRRALWLVGGTMAYNVIEATVAVWSGIRAQSVALVSFGLDSVIECAAATMLFWRLVVEWRGAGLDAVNAAERKVHRFVGVTFLALALYVTVQAIWTLWRREPPGESFIGITLAAVSLIIMPLASWGKLRVAMRIGSAALRAEAKETLACSYLSLTLLVGLAANAAASWWWADPIAALLMVPWLVREGLEGIRGELSGKRHE